MRVGVASLVDARTVRVVEETDGGATKETLLRAPHVLVAVGGVPAALPASVAGGELAITSDGFFDLPLQPRKVAVIGAGYIAVEVMTARARVNSVIRA